MSRSEMHRRDFHKLTAAALGGIVAGSVAGCGGKTEKTKTGEKTGDEEEGHVHDDTLILQAKHICRGINMCKGQGKGGDNACAGQGACATAKAHSCHGKNECKGQGGCGGHIGINECAGKGECAVPLTDASKWKVARETFEEAMKEKHPDKKIGDAPAATAE
jgi:hypothetical protein